MATRERTLEEELARFVKRWTGYKNTELAGAQSFLRELQECYGIWEHAPGTVFEQHPVKPVAETNGVLFADAPKRGRAARTGVDAARMDMYIPKVVVWEMKGPEERDLTRHHGQLLGYWARTRPRYMVLCNFHEFWIYDTDAADGQLNPAHRFTLDELPEHASALLFLKGEEAYFAQRSANVTREAAEYVGGVLRELLRASGDPKANRQRYSKFTLECVFAMFAEDAGILHGNPFTQAMKAAQLSGDLSPVYNLFDDLGREDSGDRSAAVPYVNGPLFDRQHPKFPVAKTILATLYTAASGYDWQAVRPEVFGSIFERALLAEERAPAGAHFTAEGDIMKVVGPTVIRPWQERIAACKFRKEAEALIARMQQYHILDPACGSGNFLYVAYREMKRLEAALRTKHYDLWNHKERKRFSEKYPAPPPGPWFSVHQLHGIDKLTEAVQLTRVVLWIGEHLANVELNLGESTLPLTSLEQNIVEGDALFMDWPRPDGELAIVGNPPFMGGKKMRMALGDEYINKLHKAFPHNRMADLVTYWYPKAIETLRLDERAGFVSTNSIAQNESREASLDRIVAAGSTIHDAWKSYPWPGEAAVHVSIVNWIQGSYDGAKYLDATQTDTITPTLTDQTDISSVKKLQANLGICYQGVVPGNKEFVLSDEQRTEILLRDPDSAGVIKPFLIGADTNRRLDQSPSRYIIDFGSMTLEEARKFKGAFRYAQKHIYPVRKEGLDRKEASKRENWWQMVRPRGDMRTVIASIDSYLTLSCVTPYVILTRASKDILPDHRLFIFGLPEFYHFGILQSAIHEAWAWARGSTLEDRLAYTNTTIFETFPFPPLAIQGSSGAGVPACHPGSDAEKSTGTEACATEDPLGMADETQQVGGTESGDKRVAAIGMNYDPRVVPTTKEAKLVAKVAEKLYAKRQEACRALGLGLTKLYNLIKGKTPVPGLDSPVGAEQCSALPANAAKTGGRSTAPPLPEVDVATRIAELRTLHNQLNAAVCACYGWEPETWRNENEVLARLLELNQALAAG